MSMFNLAHFNEILKTKVVYAPYLSGYVYELKKINASKCGLKRSLLFAFNLILILVI